MTIFKLAAPEAIGQGLMCICCAAAARDKGLSISVLGVEQVPGAVHSARKNAQANGLSDVCRFEAADATEYMATRGREEHFDVVIMDPPRAGSTPQFLSGVLALAPRRVVYVSCNATTQARDLEQLRDGGYRLERLTPVDMFPHTKHVETVATLVRD